MSASIACSKACRGARLIAGLIAGPIAGLITCLGASLVLPSRAEAAVACSATAAALNLGPLDIGRPTPTRVTGSVSVNCTRSDLATDPATVHVALGVNSGLLPSGDMSRARRAGGATQDTLDYWLWRDAAETLAWTDKQGTNSTRLVATLGFGSGATASQSIPFHATVPPTSAQTRPLATGVYPDTQMLSLYQSTLSASDALRNSKSVGTTPFTVQVTVPENCVLSSPPGNLAFAYTSFQAVSATASTSFAVTCATNVSYALSLDATTGTLAGLAYTLALSTLSQVGTGVPQSATISGMIAAGQSGVCSSASCTASAVRTLTVTY